VEGLKKNMAQLARIGAMVEWRYDLKEKNEEKDENNKKRSKDGSGESQEEVEMKTPLFTSY